MQKGRDDAKIIEFLHHYGHLSRPFGNPQDIPTDLSKLTLRDTCVKEAIRSHQAFDANYEIFSQALHHRSVDPDGDIGPATELVLDLDRCYVADYEDESVAMAVGSGNWRGCHGVGNFHSASIKVVNSPPSFLAPVFEQVKERIVEAYAEVGLLLHFDGRSPVNITWEFVGRSSGWIGLAQVVNNATCNSGSIFCRYLATYRGGNSDDAIITQWTTLGKHELGHNTGMGHTSGGVMNPSLINGLPVSWRNDTAWRLLVSRFGGERVPRTPNEMRKLMLAWKYPDGRYEDVAEVPNRGGGFWPN